MSANPHNAGLGLPESESVAEAAELSSSAVSHRPAASNVSAPGHEALQALLAFSSLHEQLRQRRAREKSGEPLDADVWELEQFVLDEVLQLLAELILAALKPEEENRLAEISQRLVAEEPVEAPPKVQGEESASTQAAGPAQKTGAAEPEIASEIFQEYGKKQKFTFRIGLLVL